DRLERTPGEVRVVGELEVAAADGHDGAEAALAQPRQVPPLQHARLAGLAARGEVTGDVGVGVDGQVVGLPTPRPLQQLLRQQHRTLLVWAPVYRPTSTPRRAAASRPATGAADERPG